MSETNTKPEDILKNPDYLKNLKAKADLMGIAYSNNISAETLRKKIEDKLEGGSSDKPDNSDEPNPLSDPSEPKKLTKAERRNQMILEQTRLIRCRINNLDPKKQDLPGEIITVGNPIIGTIKKFIPFGEFTENGYHIPKILFDFLENRRFLHIRTITDRKSGQTRVEANYTKEFSLEVLPPLTAKELADLKAAQTAAGGYS